MNAKTLAELVLKIWGITLLVSALASLPISLLMAAAGSGGSEAQDRLIRFTNIASILSVVIQAAVGAAVIVWADRITDSIESDTTPIQIGTNITELQVLGFGLAGVFFLVGGLQSVASAAFVLLTKPKLEGTDALSYMWDRQKETIVRGFVEVAAGVLLLFGREAIANGWSRLRGQSRGDDEADFKGDAD